MADALGVPLVYRTDSDVGAALGAARLAMIADAPGNRETAIARVCRQPVATTRHEPRAARTTYHREKLARYRKLYQLTKSVR